MEPVLARAMKHDDVWLAFSLLRGPDRYSGDDQQDISPALLLIDNAGEVFAATQPRRFPVGKSLADLNPDLAEHIGTNHAESQPAGNDLAPWNGTRLITIPIHSDDEIAGLLIASFAQDALWLRFREIVFGGAWAVVLTLALFIPIGWLWGRRMIAPLATLTRCMARIGQTDVWDLQCPIPDSGDDEIGQLGRQFQLLLKDLKGKRALEQQVMAQDRLAAIGRVAAGVAHEINNPLGGLLTTIDTYRHKPVADRNPERTLALIERGLNQIHETVSALLVESRLETRAVTKRDIEDIETLIRADPAADDKNIHWRSEIIRDLPLPATSVRQILLNLVLNAVQSTPREGLVEVQVDSSAECLRIDVRNQGKHIAPERLSHLFEPFFSDRVSGTGLGLWVTYQTVTQLNGEIRVDSRDQSTLFQVALPIAQSNDEEGT